MAVIGSATLNIVPKVQGGLANAINGEISKANVSSLGKQAGSGFMGGFTSGASIGVWSSVATKAIGAVTSSLGSAASRVDTLNNYPRIMDSLGVGTDAANKSITTMSDALANVPTRLDDMANTVQGIYAASMKYGTGLDTVTDAGLALNSMLLAGGQNQQVVNSAMEQFRQMVAKGKPDLQDWRALISAAPGQMNQLAEAMLGAGASADDLYAALGGGKEGDYTGPFEWGSLSMEEFIERFADMREKFEGAAEDAQGGIATAYANMTNAVTKGVANVLDAFGQERIASAIGDVKGMINDVFGRDDTQGLRAFAAEVAPMASDAWESMVGRIGEFSRSVAPSVSGVAESLLSIAEVAGPSVGDAFDAILDAAEAAAPAVAETLSTVADVAGDTIKGIAGIVGDVAPVVSSIAQDVLPVVADVVEAVGPALPVMVTASAVLGGFGSLAGGLSAAGAGISGVAGALGAIGSVAPMVGSLADIGPAISLVAESGKLLGASGAAKAVGGVVTAIADVAPMVSGLSDIPAALALVAESGGGLAAALNPLPIVIGAAAVGVGALGVSAYSSWKRERDFSDALEGVAESSERVTHGLGEGYRQVEDYAVSTERAHANIEGLESSMRSYADRVDGINASAGEQIGLLGQYRTIIDECAGAGEVSADKMGMLQWALSGLADVTGETYSAEQVLAGAYGDERDEVSNLISDIDNLIAKRQEQARTDALQQSLTEAMKLQGDAATELSRAQGDAAQALQRVNTEMQTQGITYEEAYEWTKQHVSSYHDVLDNLEKATDAYDEATAAVDRNKQLLGMSAQAADDASDSFSAWVNSHTLASSAILDTNTDLSALSGALEAAGVSTEALDEMGEKSFSQLVSTCNGSVDQMVAALALYNSVPVEEKDGDVVINDAKLIDALGNIYHFNENGTLVDQYGNVAVDDTQLVDCQGKVYTWNGTSLDTKNAVVTTSEGGLGGLLSTVQGFMSVPDFIEKHASYTTSYTTTHTDIYNTVNNSSVGGHYSQTATGGHIVPRHAAGYIAAGPTRTNWGIVGEDGIEAVYNNADGTSDVYPLNNPRYLGYADPLADRIASAIEGKAGGGDVYNITVYAKGDSGDEIANAVVGAIRAQNLRSGHATVKNRRR